MSLEQVKITPIEDEKFVPTRANKDDVGYDLMSTKTLSIYPGETVTIPVGFKIEIPSGYEAQIRPRSGLARKQSISIVNSPGTIDPGYRGEVGAILINHGKEPFLIREGDKIAQMVFNKVETPELIVVEALSDSDRGEGGFGSTGV
jgi:dUTP pyrophosphatase